MHVRTSTNKWRKLAEWGAVGGLSAPSKMPGFGYGLPARVTCKTGGKLASVKGSTCESCYADSRGNYRFNNVKAAQFRRLDILQRDLIGWSGSMMVLISKLPQPEFRWHDSGDIQSAEHLAAIVEIARALPEKRFWLPTRELGFIAQYLDSKPEGWTFPENLAVRFSAPMVGRTLKLPKRFAAAGVVTSSVGAADGGHACAASRMTADKHCGDCRACWDVNIPNVDYALE